MTAISPWRSATNGWPSLLRPLLLSSAACQAVFRAGADALVGWGNVSHWILDVDEDFWGVENVNDALKTQGPIASKMRACWTSPLAAISVTSDCCWTGQIDIRKQQQISDAAKHFCVSDTREEAEANNMLLGVEIPFLACATTQ